MTSRRVAFFTGLLVVAAAWFGPLPSLAKQAFAAHMLMHMSVVAVAAPLIAIGIAGRPWDPVRLVPKVFSPIVASVAELVVVWGWHAPTLHHLARHSAPGLTIEQGTFFLSGLFLWLSVLGGDHPRDARRAVGLIGLLLTSMHMTLLGALLALTPRPLYHDATGLSALTSIQDQHLGGAIMLLIGGVSYLAGGLWIMAGLLRRRSPDVSTV
jgi:putative membrane protein